VENRDFRSYPKAHDGKRFLGGVTVFFWFAQYVYIPFLTPYLFTLSMTATTVGLIVGAYGVTQLVLRIPVGITVDIIRNHKLFILSGTFLAGLSSLGMMIFPSPVLLFVANALSGAASSTWISFTILYPAYYEKWEGTKAIATITQLMSAGTLAAFIVGGILFERVGIRGLFIASFASGMAGCVLALFIRREPAAGRVNISIRDLIGVMKEKRLLFPSIMGVFMNLVIFGTVFSFTTSTAKNLGATGMELGICAALHSAAVIPGAYFVRTRIAYKAGEKNLLLLAFLLLGIYCAGIAFSHAVVSFFPLQVIAGLGHGILVSSLMAQAIRYIDEERKSTAMGFYQSVYCIGMTMGPVFMGFLVDYASTRASFIIMAFIALACAAAMPPMYRSNLLVQTKTS
jgi:MFS family permease